MNKKLRDMLEKIENKKAEAREFLNQGKKEEARTLLNEIKNLQEEFDIAKDLYDQEKEDIEDKVEKQPIVDAKKGLNAFVNIFKSAVLKKTANEEDVKIYNMMTEADPVGGVSDGGITVPQDIRTQIMELRRSEDALETLVNVEPVSTLSGSRVIEVNADQVPFDNVDEAAEFPDVETPQFENITYKVKKKGGILKVTRELLQDTAENIIGYLRRWIAKKSKVTRNFLILGQLDSSFGGAKTKELKTLDDFKDVFNVSLDPAIAISSRVLTNQDGFNWLDKLKDIDGKYVLQPDPTNATKKLLFGSYPVTVVTNKVLPTTSKNVPFYMGDFKEAITLFDRETLSIEFSTEAGDLWGKDLTGVKVRERLDIKTVDKEAVVKGVVDITPVP
ncbi:phage major capsid protein [Paenibacillus sp. D2_2]|uniref:phage major capsid protein n=1 Tax=Paenibacillus sp. D2_2 TaxID=3073092 RepID=UPI0028152322|nr:phage major capsid protein [Paenibacillus sp. D2_2]WMT42844.1 phage major capsid protein [Paenibacillus sp. D2_2]